MCLLTCLIETDELHWHNATGVIEVRIIYVIHFFLSLLFGEAESQKLVKIVTVLIKTSETSMTRLLKCVDMRIIDRKRSAGANIIRLMLTSLGQIADDGVVFL